MIKRHLNPGAFFFGGIKRPLTACFDATQCTKSRNNQNLKAGDLQPETAVSRWYFFISICKNSHISDTVTSFLRCNLELCAFLYYFCFQNNIAT